MPLWNALMEAGKDLDVHAGCPNGIERGEGGLLSYGKDMNDDNTPHECGLGRFCDIQTATGCMGRDALLSVAKEGPIQQIRAIEIAGDKVPGCDRVWPLMAGDKRVGQVVTPEGRATLWFMRSFGRECLKGNAGISGLCPGPRSFMAR